jgi:tetratricopeptide (TPR) repeat protein
MVERGLSGRFGVLSRDGLVKGLLALTLLVPSLCLGAVHPPFLAGAAFCGVLTFFAVLRHPRLAAPRFDFISTVLLGLAALTALQIVPLPSGVVEVLNPAVYEVRSRALRPLGGPSPSFMSLSLDLTFTAIELVKLFLYLCVYWSCQCWIRSKGSRYVSVLVVASGAACAGVFLAHRLLMLDLVYGVYKPLHVALSSTGGRISAPLLNENHMAALFGLAAAMAIGLALEVQDRGRRLLAIAGAGVIGGAMLLTFSRGGIVAFILGQLLFLSLRLLHRTRKSHDEKTGGHLGWVPLGLAASLGLGFFSAQDLIVGEFLHGDASKLEMAWAAAPLIRDFGSTGVGRGAYWVGFGAYDPLVSLSTATHAENVVVQLLADYGVIFGGAAILSFLAMMVRELWDVPRRPTRAAALAGLVAFGVHNLVDFNIEVPGVAVLATAVLAVARFGGLGGHSEPKVSMVRLPGSFAYGFAGLALSLGLFVPIFVAGRTVDEDGRRILAAYRAEDPAPFDREALRQVLSRHPADGFVPLVAGIRLYQSQQGNPLPWLARAIEVAPHNALAHLYVGLSLLRVGRQSQGFLELRLAAEYSPRLTPNIAEQLVERHSKFEVVSQIAVTDEQRRRLWPAIADALARRHLLEETAKADEAILRVDPHAPRSLARTARRRAQNGEMEEAFASAKTLALVPGHEAAGALLQAELHRSLGEHAEAVKALERRSSMQPRDTGLLGELARARLRAGDREGAFEAAVAMRNLAQTPQARAAGYALEAELEAASGNARSAMARFRDAHNIDGSRTTYLWRVAHLAQNLKDEASLLEALRKIVIVDPSDEKAKAQLAELHSRHQKRRLLGER